MDLLYAHAAEVEKTVFFQIANLFNLEVDLIFYDTTTASFAVDYEDNPEQNPDATLRHFGHSKEGIWSPQVWWLWRSPVKVYLCEAGCCRATRPM